MLTMLDLFDFRDLRRGGPPEITQYMNLYIRPYALFIYFVNRSVC